MTEENPWRLCTWSDGNYHPVKVLAFHEEELAEVLALPFPPNAEVREPIERLTDFSKEYTWFRRLWCGFKFGDFFQENWNQGLRDCQILAIDEKTGDYLYEYDMPCGKTFMRTRLRGSVSRKNLPKKWLKLMEE